MDTKICFKCKVEKPIEEFHRDKNRKDRRCPYCKACTKTEHRKTYERSEAHQLAVANRKYYEETKEERKKERYHRYNTSEKNKANQRRYQKTEKCKAMRRRFVQSPKGSQLWRSYVHIRRAKRANNGGSYSPAEWKALCQLYEFHCLRCGKVFEFDELTVDHVIPIALGGTSNIDNLQPLCLSCNQSKHDRIIDYRTKKIWWKQLSLF